MSDHIIKTIEEIREEIQVAEEAVRPKKLLVNQLCERAGIQPIYPGIDESSSNSGKLTIRRNAFYGRPLSTCMREILEMRAKLPVKEATLEEIQGALKEGGYDLRASGDNGVSIALGKNSQTFHRLASGDWGLVEWYPNIKEKRSAPPRPQPAAEAPTASPSDERGVDPAVRYARVLRERPTGSPEVFTTEDGPEDLK